jgi:hypothetical protein
MDTRRLLLTVLLGGALLGAFSQRARLTAQPVELTPPPRSVEIASASGAQQASQTDGPLIVGERLLYHIVWSNIPSAARMELELTERGRFFGQESYQLRTRVQTLDQAWSLLGEIDNLYTTYLHAATALPHRIVQSVNQGLQPAIRGESEPSSSPGRSSSTTTQQRLGEEVILLDQTAQLATYDDQSTQAIAPSTFDLPSLVYGLRLSPPLEGERRRLAVLFGRQRIEIEVRATGSEQIVTQTGTFQATCFQLSPRQPFRRYRASLCLSSDERRLPVAIRVNLPIGEVRAELISATLQPPLDSGVGALQVGAAGAVRPLPFAIGERLGYDISWGNFVSVGRASFEVRQQGLLGQRPVLELHGEAISTGAARTLLNVHDQISSFLQVEELRPLRTDLRLREGRRRKIDSARFLDQQTARLNNGTLVELPSGTLDLLSLFYVVRATLPEIGQAATYPFLDANHRLQRVLVRSVKPERISTLFGEQETLQIDILSPSTGNPLLAQAWLSRDATHLPVYFVTRTRFGELRFQLVSRVLPGGTIPRQ